jgi:dUTP pyrophosphatase
MRIYLTEAFRALGIPFTAPRPGDAGYDLYAVEETVLPPGASALIPTGLHAELPEMHVGLIRDRSSMALKEWHTYSGVIDAGYRGEIKVFLVNLSDHPQTILRGQKFAQMVVVPIYAERVHVVESVDQLRQSVRGQAGFGSTGA